MANLTVTASVEGVVPPLGPVAVLQSYHDRRKDRIADYRAKYLPADTCTLFFLDSGAFSARSVGAVIVPEEYAAYVVDNSDAVHIAANLDVHMDETSNLAMLTKLRTLGANVLPVCHPGISWKQFEAYCEEFPLVLLGGMVGISNSNIVRWIDHAFTLMARHGTVAHGFGQTDTKIVSRFPFWSCDSTSWLAGVRYGQVKVWNGRRIVGCDLQDTKSRQKMASVLLAAGVTPGAVAGKERMHYRASADITFMAYRKWAQSMRDRHGPVSLRDGSLPDGFHVFLAGGWDWRHVSWFGQ